MTDVSYLRYLQNRSLTGLIYRRCFLYPRLSRHVSGVVLDFGCGIGDFLKFCNTAIGVDVDPDIVAFCRSRGFDAYVSDRGGLPFDDHSFDSVVMDNVLEHIEEPQSILGEILRVLKPGGVLLVGVPGERGWSADADHKVWYGERELIEVLELAKFRLKKTFFTPLFRSQILSRLLRQYCIYGVFVKNDGICSGELS